MDYMGAHGIGIEANLTSNVQTSTVPDLASHPLRRFLSHGLLATINTDDPAISGINLPHEYTVAAPQAGLSEARRSVRPRRTRCSSPFSRRTTVRRSCARASRGDARLLESRPRRADAARPV